VVTIKYTYLEDNQCPSCPHCMARKTTYTKTFESEDAFRSWWSSQGSHPYLGLYIIEKVGA